MVLTDLEQLVVDEIAHPRDELVALARDLIGFDTTTRAYHTELARGTLNYNRTWLTASARPEPKPMSGNPYQRM